MKIIREVFTTISSKGRGHKSSFFRVSSMRRSDDYPMLSYDNGFRLIRKFIHFNQYKDDT